MHTSTAEECSENAGSKGEKKMKKSLYPVCEVVGCFISQAVARRLAGDELEEYHSEAVDVASRTDVGFDIRRVDIPRRSGCPCQHVRCVGAKVGELGMEVVIQ